MLHTDDELITEDELLQLPLFRRITPKVFGQLRRQGLVPVTVLGHRTFLYRPSAVAQAIRRLERNSPKEK